MAGAVRTVLEELRARAEAAPGAWQKDAARAGDTDLLLGWRADARGRHRVAVKALPDGARREHAEAVRAALPALRAPALRLTGGYARGATWLLLLEPADGPCRRCGEPLDVVARAAGAPTCSACAFAAGELEPMEGFLVRVEGRA